MEGTKEKIKKDLNHLYWDRRVNADEIEVEVLDGTVILTGTVTSHFAKLSASEDAWNILGVWSVDNRLKVRYPVEVITPPGETKKLML